MSEIGFLSNDLRKLIDNNFQELSTIEGNILGAGQDINIKTIYVTSCSPKEGKSVVAVSMAYALAEEALAKVLLIDGNFNSPSIHNTFSVNISPGLTDIFREDDIKDLLPMDTEIKNLKIIPNGEPLSKTFNIFRNKTFVEIFNTWKQRFDYIIFDGNSMLGSLDTFIIAKNFDGIILVVECERTKWEVVQVAKEKIAKVKGNILGVVLNKRKFYIPKIFNRLI